MPQNPTSPSPDPNAEQNPRQGAAPSPPQGWAPPPGPGVRPPQGGATPGPGSGSAGGPGYGPPPGYAQGTGSAPVYGGAQATGSSPRHYAPDPGVPGPPTGGYRPQPGPQPTQALDSPAAAPAADDAGAAAESLTVNKVVAGAGAAATSAVLGSFFGAMGTVAGAAVGSIFITLVTTGLEQSLNKTRDTVRARVKLPGGRSVEVTKTTEVPAPPAATGAEAGTARVFVTPGDDPTEVLPVVSADGATRRLDGATVLSPAAMEDPAATAVAPTARRPRSRKKLLVMTAFAVIVFAISMVAVTGIELVKGSPLNTSSSSSGQRPGGTSLGSVLGGGGDRATTQTDPTEESTPATEDPSDQNDVEPTPQDEAPSPSAGRSRPGVGAEETQAPTRSPRVTPTPTPDADPAPSDGTGGGAQPNARSGGATNGPDQQ